MFKINTNNRTTSDLARIADNYEVLHFDEYPILFIGSNKYHNKIIGSLVCEDEDSGEVFRYFYSIITDRTYFQFINQKPLTVIFLLTIIS